jgi:hypothetical protein
LTPVDDVNKYGANDAVGVTRAPGLQGTYGGCNDQNSFIFDAVTDAYIEFPNSKAGTITDMPLALDSKPIRYQQVRQNNIPQSVSEMTRTFMREQL